MQHDMINKRTPALPEFCIDRVASTLSPSETKPAYGRLGCNSLVRQSPNEQGDWHRKASADDPITHDDE